MSHEKKKVITIFEINKLSKIIVMSQNIKAAVILFLVSLPKSKYEQFNKALGLYKKLPNKEDFQLQKLNRVGFSDSNLEFLLYDLKKLCAITDIDLVKAKPQASPKMKVVGDDEPQVIPQFILDMNQEQLREWAKNSQVENRVAGLEEIIEIVLKDESFELVIRGEITEILMEELTTILNSQEHQEYLKGLETENTTKSEHQPLREEYPFLNDKNCPDILHTVVGRKVAAFKRYEENHAKLQQVLDKTLELPKVEEDELAKLVEEDYNENLALHKELQYYKENGKLLGEHPLFAQTVITREVENMTKDECLKFINSSSKYFHDQTKKIEKASGDETKILNVNRLILNREFKLNLVKQKLGVSE
jgi:hypothetical protein